MLGIIDVGGGNRGSYGSGVMDYFLEQGVSFDYGIGVSAGAANIITFFAGQKGRTYRFYSIYNLRREAMSFSNYFKKGNFVDIDYLYKTLSVQGGEDPLDFNAFLRSGKTLWIVATDALTGKPVYFDAKDMELNDYGALGASSNVPGVNRACSWRGGLYYDGGISDPVPVEKALSDGCDKVLVILTRPRDYVRTSGKDRWMSLSMKRKYPRAAQAFRNRAAVYNAEVALCKKLEKEGKVKILAPDSIGRIGTLGQDPEPIRALYEKGYRDAGSALDFLRPGPSEKNPGAAS